MTGRYLEDFAVGQTFGSGRLRVEKERIKTFAAEFDPQPFHLDEEAARGSIFRGLGAISSKSSLANSRRAMSRRRWNSSSMTRRSRSLTSTLCKRAGAMKYNLRCRQASIGSAPIFSMTLKTQRPKIRGGAIAT